MPSKKKKYNARFPAGRIKKIMQSDEEIGKVAQAVPVIISRTLELFVESLLTKTLRITNSRNSKTLSTSHMKQCIMSEQRFDFLKELVKNIPDISVAEEAGLNYNDDELRSSPEEQYPDSDTPYDLSLPSTSVRAPVSNGVSTFARSVSLNGANYGGTKRQYQQHPLPSSASPSVIMQTAAAFAHLQQQHQQAGHLPAKLARSESTPAYCMQRNSRQSQETAIPAQISSYALNKPIVKIDYSNMQIPNTTLGVLNEDYSGKGNSSTTSSFDNAAPVINIDLTNIVAGGSIAVEQPTICYDSSLSTNNIISSSKNTTTVNSFAGSSRCSSAPLIPKATAATAAINDYELDEDYDSAFITN